MNFLSQLTALTLGLVVFFCPPVSADDFDESPIAVEAGYRQDSLYIRSWNRKNHRGTIEKQHWRNINTFAFGISGATYTEYNVFLKGKLDYGKVYKVDLDLNTPFLDTLDRYHKSHHGGNTYAASIAVGFPIWFDCRLDWLHFIPLVGFDYDRLKLRTRERIRTPGYCEDLSRSCGCSESRHRHHRHRCFVKARIHDRVTFESPWVGLDFSACCCKWKFFGGYQYNYGRFRSSLEYNVKNNFSYKLKDHTWGHANEGHLGVGYQFSTEWETALNLRYKDWKSHHGKHKAALNTPDGTTCSNATIKNVHWEVWEVLLYLILRY